MKHGFILLIAGFALMLGVATAPAQLFQVTTLAGSAGTNGAVNGTGLAAQFYQPQAVALDAAGNIFVADTANHVIRKITTGGVVSTFAGTVGVAGFTNATGTNAAFNAPQSLAHDSLGNWFVADTANHIIRKIAPDGTVSTFAGSPGASGIDDGTNSAARFFAPQGVAVDGADNVFVSDTLNHSIRRITSAGVVTTIAGLPGFPGVADGTNSLAYTNNGARLNQPAGLAVDAAGNIFVADSGNHTIRKISPAGTNWVSSTVAGLPSVFGSADGTNSVARFLNPLGVALDAAGNVFVADSSNQTIREISAAGTNWVVSTVAGLAGTPGSADGSGIAAQFLHPAGLAVDATGRLILADGGNSTVRSGSVITNTPVVFLTQPQSLTVNQNSNATFNVSLSGAANVYFQWYFNGAAILGANTNSFTVTAAQLSDAGTYSVLVATPTGTAMSSNAVLTVNSQPQFIIQPSPQVCALGGSASFAVLAMTEPLAYQWRKNGVALTNNARFSGVTTPTLTVTGATTNEAAFYSVTISNVVGLVTSTVATLTVSPVPPLDAVMPAAWWPLNDGFGNAALDASGNGHYGTLNGVTWTNNGHGGIGANFNGSGATIGVTSELTQSGDWTAAMWVYRRDSGIGSALISGGSTALKLEQWNNTGKVGYSKFGSADYTFNYSAPLSAWTHLVFVKTTNGITLYTNGVAGPVNTNVITLGVATLGRAGADYLDAILNDVRIYNQALSAGQISNLFTAGIISAPTNTQPVITNQPVSAVCLQGTNATFSVGVSGPLVFYPTSYRWFRNSLPLADGGKVSGSTTATLNLSGVTTNDAGGFFVVATNVFGAVTSSVVTLTVYALPPADFPAPVAWWLFNEGGGAQALDYSGNGHTCTLGGGVTWTNGVGAGSALNFNGTASAVATVVNPFTRTNDWTATMWVWRRDSSASSALLAGSATALKLEQWNNTGKVGYTVFGSADYTLNYSAPTNVWTQLVFVKTSAGVSLFANGVLVATNSAALSLGVATVGRASADYLDARLGETRLYNLALTVSQVTNLFAYGRTSFSRPGIVAASFNSLTITGAVGQPYTILTGTNLVLPLSEWSTQAAGVFDVTGLATFTNVPMPTPALFYRVRSP